MHGRETLALSIRTDSPSQTTPFTMSLSAWVSRLTARVPENGVIDWEIERNGLRHELGRTRVLHHQPERWSGTPGVVTTSGISPGDHALVNRVATAYQAAMSTPVGGTDSIWLDFFAKANEPTHEVLSSGDSERIAAMLRNPAESMLFYGFDNLSAAEAEQNADPGWQQWLHIFTYSNLLKLAEAVGVVRLDNPEVPYQEGAASASIEALIKGLDDVFGFQIEFPNLFAGEIGLETSRGVASYRAVQALYQAHRIRELLGGELADARVLEIGAGLGRTALYARKGGIAHYSIVDLPLTNVAQGYFLGQTLGEDAVCLWGENRAGVKITPPSAFLQGEESYDLVVNFDSLTELSPVTAAEYFDAIASRSKRFLSINHEHNSFTVRDLYRERRIVPVSRMPCWVRRGYVEELITFSSELG